jgi:hypothetical protein
MTITAEIAASDDAGFRRLDGGAEVAAHPGWQSNAPSALEHARPALAEPRAEPATVPTLEQAFAAREAEVAHLRTILPSRLIDQERLASRSRWHGYRFMSALECTWRFARDYETQFSITYGMRCAMRPEVGSKDFEVLWEMRQAADDMSISYQLYLEISFQPVRNRLGPFGKPHLVFARHQKRKRWLKLYNKRLIDRWAIDFSRAAELPQFHLANDHGLPDQKHFRKKVGASRKVHEAVEQARKYALERRIVPVGDVLARLSDEDRREAVERLKLKVTLGQISRHPDPEPLEPGQLIQACFGWSWRGAQDDRCSGCMQMAGCRAAQQLG